MPEDIIIFGREGRRYKILSATPIDHGSTSQLFLGEQIAPPDEAGRRVAVKVALSIDQKPAFAKEVEVLSLLWDMVPGAVPEVYDANLEATRPYLVMEYLASVQSLADLAREGSEGCLSEKVAVYWASRYAEVLGALHDVDFAAPDRKLGDLLLVDLPAPAGNDYSPPTSKQEGNRRLVVVDWGGVASLTPSLAQFDLLLFTQFWYTLMLGGYSLPDINLGTRRLDHHRRWEELSYGVRQILSRGLSRVTQRRYREIGELLGDWRELEVFWGQSPNDLEQAFKQARQDRAYERALKCLDVMRLVDRPRWQKHEPEIDPLLNEIGVANVLVKQIKEAIRRGESLADANIRGPLKRGSEQYGDDPEWQLRSRRWMILAEFSGSLSAEAHSLFREEIVEPWIAALEAMEEERWEEASGLFWQPLNRLLSPNGANPQIEAKINSARELLHTGKRIDAQERIGAVVEELSSMGLTSSKAAINLLRNAFFSDKSHFGAILSLLVEIDLRQHMLNLVIDLSSGHVAELYASSNAVSKLREELSYIALLENAGVIWPSKWQNSLNEQLNLCEKADRVLAEAAALSDQGDFQAAQWALEAMYRQFDFLVAIDLDSTQTLTSEVNSVLHKKRYQLKAELKRVADLMQIDQLLEQNAKPGEFAQVLATLEIVKGALDNTYFRQRTAGMIEQVRSVLRSGPVLISLQATLKEKGRNTAKGDTA